MRRKKHGAERLAACAEYILPDEKTDSRVIFGNDNPVHLEIGCGKGDFILGMAIANPDINFIAVERVSDVLVLAAEKISASGVHNVRLAVMNAADVCDRFAPGSISRIYLNFSDPWPKKGYAKRRLTYRSFLQLYKAVMTTDGSLYMKTDDLPLFEFSCAELTECGFDVTCVTNDLHASEYAAGNVMTEYERNFTLAGKKINSLRAFLKG